MNEGKIQNLLAVRVFKTFRHQYNRKQFFLTTTAQIKNLYRRHCVPVRLAQWVRFHSSALSEVLSKSKLHCSLVVPKICSANALGQDETCDFLIVLFLLFYVTLVDVILMAADWFSDRFKNWFKIGYRVVSSYPSSDLSIHKAKSCDYVAKIN